MDNANALFFDGHAGRLRLAHLPRPNLKRGETLVRVEAATICGSDVHTIHKRREVLVPTILGHEILGFVEDFGEDASRFDARGGNLEIGDRVVWGVVAHCGACGFCGRGLTQKCSRATKYGHEKAEFGSEWTGGFGEWCVLAPGTTVVKVPFEIPAGLLCPASCSTATVFSAMEAAGDLSGKTVLITGAGLLGATAILVSRFYGAKKIFVVEALEYRRLKAIELGASDAFPPGDLLRNVEIRPIDVFLEFSGSNSAWEVGTRFLSTGGVAVLIGSVFPSQDASINLETVVRRMWTIRGVHNYGPRHLIRAVDFLTNSEIALSLTGLVGPWFTMGQYTEALEQAVKPEIYRTGFLMERK